MRRILFIIKSLASTRFLIKRSQRQFIRDAVRGKHFVTVIDVGAGRAPYKNLIDCDEYIGVDVEDRGGVHEVIIADLNHSLPIADAKADLVLCTEVLEHVKNPDTAVRELYRIIKKGGMLVFTTPLVWPIHEAPHDYYRYTNFGLGHLFNNAGFSNIVIKSGNSYFFTLCQLFNAPLRKRAFIPLVIFVNILGLVAMRFGKNFDLPIDYQLIAYKK